MGKKSLFFKKARKMLVVGFIMVSSLTACGSNSELKQEYELSSYKNITVYKEYDPKFEDLSNFKKNHGYMSIESENDGANIVFQGFYQMKCVHIGTCDLTEAFKTNTVKEFAEICGYKNYNNMVSNPLFKCTSDELFNYNDYIVYFEKLDTGGANLYLGKKFEYTFENDETATSVFNDIMGLLNKDECDRFDYEQLKNEDGSINQDARIPYAVSLGLNLQEGENIVKKDELVGDTNYNYNIYLKMEEYLLSLDKDCADVLEKSKNGDDSKAPQF